MKNTFKNTLCAVVVLMLVFSAISVNGVKLYRDLDVTEHDLTNANSVIFAAETRTSIESKSASKGTLEVADDGTVLVNTNGTSTGWKEVGAGGTEGETKQVTLKLVEEGMGARLTYTDGLLKGVIEYEIGKEAVADLDVKFKSVPDDSSIDTLEWDLQSFTTVDNLQFSSFSCGETEITAAQYCRFMNAYKDRFSDKSNPSCAVTSVFNNAQGGAWVDVQPVTNLCTIRATADTSYNNSYSKIKWDSGSSTYQFNVSDWHTNQPMTEVSWYGAVAYCMWLNEEEFGSDTTKWKYRLPTEWEYEFMMGAKSVASTSGGVQDWGSASWKYGMQSDTISHTYDAINYVSYVGDAVQGLKMVGSKGGPGKNAVNEFECYELSGNVWNWCLDWYGATAGDVSGKDYVHKTLLGSRRSVRGGRWRSTVVHCTTSHRNYNLSELRNEHVGFRVVRSQ